MKKNHSAVHDDSFIQCSAADHQECIRQALQRARALCQQQGLRLTPIRQRVLELVWGSHQPQGAYDILARFSKQAERPAAPPTIYRALDFLLQHGLVHRLASLNAYIGCSRPEQNHQGYFLICRLCSGVRELPETGVGQAIRQAADRLGFAIEQQVVEVSGLCAPCKEQL